MVLIISLAPENRDHIYLPQIIIRDRLLQTGDLAKVVLPEANTPDLIIQGIPIVLLQTEGIMGIVAVAILILVADIRVENLLQMIQEDLIPQVIVNPDLPMFPLTMVVTVAAQAKEEAVAAVTIVLLGQVLNLLIPVHHQAVLQLGNQEDRVVHPVVLVIRQVDHHHPIAILHLRVRVPVQVEVIHLPAPVLVRVQAQAQAQVQDHRHREEDKVPGLGLLL